VRKKTWNERKWRVLSEFQTQHPLAPLVKEKELSIESVDLPTATGKKYLQFN
jgi:hypothetical protein